MEPISKSLPSVPGKLTLPSSSNALSKPGSQKLAKVAIAVDRILRGRPEVRVENPDYLDGLTETLEVLTDEELAWITDPREGLATRCKYLPTPADVFELIREKRAWRDRINPTTSWQRLTPDDTPDGWEPDGERRKRTVRDTLGYDPSDRARHHQPKPMTDQQIAELPSKSKYRGIPLSAEARRTIGLPPGGEQETAA